MLEGDNLLGSPSCTAYLNGTYLGMDDEMKLLIDTELYHRMRMEHGMPSMLDDVLIANREHDARMSSGGVDYDATISDSSRTWLVNKAEIEHIYKKHSDYFVTRKYPDETDLTQATFIIPIRIESEDRLRNVITSVAFLLNNFNTNIIVKEVDKTSVFAERALPQLESFFGEAKVKHIFEESDEPLFHRQKSSK